MNKTKYNYWTLYYRKTEELAMCLRSTTPEKDISQVTLRRMLNELARHEVIDDDLPLLRKHSVDCESEWEMCIAFDLCSCVELFQTACIDDAFRWRWVVITPPPS